MFNLKDLLMKNKIADVIYDTERISDDLKMSTGVTMKKYAESSLFLEPKKRDLPLKLREISKLIIDGKDIVTVYKEYLPREIIFFLKEAISNNIQKGTIIKEYLPVKKMTDILLRRIKNKLIYPFIILAVIIFGFNKLLDRFRGFGDDGVIEIPSSATFIMDNFLLINILIGAFFFVGLVIYPKKMFFIRNIFKRIDALLAVTFLKLLHEIEYSSEEAVKFTKKTFHLHKIKVKGTGLSSLAYLLFRANFINKAQATKIMSIENYKTEYLPIIDGIKDEIAEEIQLSNELVEEGVKNMTILLMATPLLLGIFAIGAIMMSVVDMSMKSYTTFGGM